MRPGPARERKERFSKTCRRWLMAPFALGSLGGKRLRHRSSFLGALLVSACYVTALCWEQRAVT
eukprot:3661527-Pyramimonas_sp.AAC.1